MIERAGVGAKSSDAATVGMGASGASEDTGLSAEPAGSAQDAAPLPSFIDALYSGYRWGGYPAGGTRYTLTYGWVLNAGTQYAPGFRPFNETERTLARQALAQWSAVCNVAFVETADVASANLQFFSCQLDAFGASGMATYPASATTSLYIDPESGAYRTYVHEIGHTLGLKHPGNYNGKGGGDPPFLPVSEDNRTNTVMSYYGIWPGTLGTYDLAAIQYLYGPNSGVRPGNDLYLIAPGAPGQYIWDGGGNDTISAAGAGVPVTIDLRDGGWGWFGAQQPSILAVNQVFIGYGTQIENAVGGNGGDVLIGSALANRIDGGFGNDTIQGGAGNDTLLGQDGSDDLSGGPGDDLLDGGDGFDRAIFPFASSSAAARADLPFGGPLSSGDGLIVTGPGGTDRLRNVETLVFTDRTIPVASAVASLPQAEPDRRALVDNGTVRFEARMDPYVGPVSWLDNQFQGEPTGEAVVGSNRADFMNLLGGNDAADGRSGDDVLDGGTGSNFLTGGAGTDTFFVDGRGGAVTWSTVTDLQPNEWAIAWGWRDGASRLTWDQMAGAGGFQGATARLDLDGKGSADMSVTFAGRPVGALAVSPGQVDGNTYLAFRLG